MTGHTVDTSINKAARIAGLAYLFIIIGYSLGWIFVYSKLIVPGNAAATANNLMARESLLRIGIACDLILSIMVIVLALTHYIILKPVNRDLSLFALFVRLGEAILSGVTVLGGFIAVLLLNGKENIAAVQPEQLQYLAGLFFNMHFAMAAIPMVFCGVGSIVFCYVFFKSKYIPGILPLLGIFSYLLLLIYSLISIVSPDYAAMMQIQIVCFLPSCIFEIATGLWLVIKGVNIRRNDDSILLAA